MSDQWDPKYPKTLPLWFGDYVKARGHIHRADSPWRAAFAAVVDAEAAGVLSDVKEFYRGTSDRWTWQLGLWDLYYKPMFQQDRSGWPAYARAVFDAVPEDWLPRTGNLDGIPEQWSDVRLIWAFKSTVLFVAGLIEGELQPAPELAMRAAVERAGEQVEGAPGSSAGGGAGREKLGERLESRPPAVAHKSGNLEQFFHASVAQAFDTGLQPLIRRLDELERRLSKRQ